MSTPEITASDASRHLRLSRESVIRLIQKGELGGGLRNGRWWADRSAVAALREKLYEQLELAPLDLEEQDR